MLYEIQKMLSVKEWGAWRCVSKRCLSSTLKDAVSRKFARVLKEFRREASWRDMEVHRCRAEDGICSDEGCVHKMKWFKRSNTHFYHSITARWDATKYSVHSIEVCEPQLAYKGAYYVKRQKCWKLPDIENLFTHLSR